MVQAKTPGVNDSGFATFVAGEALTVEDLRMKIVDGEVVKAGSTDPDIGTNIRIAASGEDVAVRLCTKEGAGLYRCSEAIDEGNPFYAAANGLVAASGTLLVGYALSTTTGANQRLVGVRKGDASIPSSLGGTTAAAFEVDSDVAKPRMRIGSQTGGTGDYHDTLVPAATLTGNRVTTLVGDGDKKVLTDYCQSVTPDDAEGAGNAILPGVTAVNVGAVTNDANDFVTLPAIAGVPIGHEIRIACNAGGNFELRTPAASNTKINDVDADGTQEYLCTDTDLVVVRKATATGWVAQSITKSGAVRTAVVPD